MTRRQCVGALAAACCAAASPVAWAQPQPREAGAESPGVPWLAKVQTPPPRPAADAPRLAPLLVDDQGRPIVSVEQWRTRREQLRAAWLAVLGGLPARRHPPPAPTVLEEDRAEGVVRQLVQYENEPGILAKAYLLRPVEQVTGAPGVVVLHSTVAHTIRQPAGLEGPPEKAFGLRLARRGCVALCPRCFLWGDDPGVPYEKHVAEFQARHPGSHGMAKMLHDALVAVDVLASLPGVDLRRIGTVGHSLGAKEALYLAAFDERVRVAVSSEGGIGTQFSNWDAPWYLGPQIRDPEFAREHHELLALVAPRAFLLVGGDSADGDRSWPFVEAALRVYRLHGSPARLGLFNHRQGHVVPTEAVARIDQWLQAYL